MQSPKIRDNKNNGRVIDEIRKWLGKDTKLSIVSSYFTIYSFYALKKELSSIREARMILTDSSFAVSEKDMTEAKALRRNLIGGDTDEKEMLRFYCDATTYGTIDNQIQNRLHELQGNAEGITLRTKLKYCCVRLFPGKEFCKYYYPFVYRHLWLLPFFWVWRIAGKGISHRKKVKRELTFLREHQ